MSFKAFATAPSRARGATARATASSTRIGQKSARPAAARHRGATRARARDDAPASEGRTVDALNNLSSLYESESEREERIRSTQRERDAMEGLGLADAFETAKRGSKTRRDFARKRTYGVTRTSFGAVIELGCAAEVVYGYWTTPAALAETLPELEKCEAAADGARARCEWVYAFGDIGKKHGRKAVDAVERHLSVVKATELEAGSSVRYEATAGMPVGADIAVTSTGANSCILDIDAWVHLPLSLTQTSGTMAVALDAQDKFYHALAEFKTLCDGGGAAARLEEIKSSARDACAVGDRPAFEFAK
jgi:hypothetical protein